MGYPPELVLRVNEVFHDMEGAGYAAVHPEIFEGEQARWDEIAKIEIAPRPRPMHVLDIGCGTGFVAERVAPLLSGKDTIDCADLSQAMLEACSRRLVNGHFPCRFGFIKLGGLQLDGPDGAYDVVTMNSVLHHLPEPAVILREIGRVLKPGGIFIVAHEPNRRFYASRWMRTRARFLGAILSPRTTVGAVLRAIGVMSLVRTFAGDPRSKRLLGKINKRLLSEALIDRPLTQDELTAIVDIQSPTAGGFHADRGIDIESLAKDHLPTFGLRLETYDHLGSGTDRLGGIAARYARRVARQRPKDGATLLAVLTKRSD